MQTLILNFAVIQQFKLIQILRPRKAKHRDFFIMNNKENNYSQNKNFKLKRHQHIIFYNKKNFKRKNQFNRKLELVIPNNPFRKLFYYEPFFFKINRFKRCKTERQQFRIFIIFA